MKKKFVLEERLILHLSRYSSFQNRYVVPFSITQDGIAKELGILRNHVPSLVRELEKKGIIYEKKSRVAGAKNIRKTYFLTKKGMIAAKKLSERITIYQKKRAPPHIPEPFFGRAKEMKFIKKWYDSHKKFLLITGMEGVGKTSLVSKFIHETTEGRVFWYSVKKHSSARGFLKELQVFMPWKLFDVSEVLESEPNSEKKLTEFLPETIVVMDDLQNASEDFLSFVHLFMNAVKSSKSGKLILVSTLYPDFPEKFRMDVLELSGLDRDSFLEMAEERGFEGNAEELYRMCQGNPSFLILSSRIGDAEEVIKNALYSIFSSLELKILELGSLYDEPMEISAFLLERESNYDTFRSLVRKGAIKRYGLEKYGVFPALMSMVRKNMSAERERSLHRTIAKYLKKIGDIHEKIMAAKHLLFIRQYENARKIIVDTWKKAITGGYEGELAEIIDLLPENARNSDIIYIEGNIFEVSLSLKKALHRYVLAEEGFRKERNTEKLAEAIRKHGVILENMNRKEEAMKKYEESLKISEEPGCMTKIYDNMGNLELVRGNYEKASEYIEKAMECAKKTGDQELIGLEYHSLGNLNLCMEKWRNAGQMYMVAIDNLKNVNNLRMLSMAYNNLAISYYKQLKLRKASIYWKKSSKISEDIGDMNLIFSEVNSANSLYKLGDFKEARNNVLRVLDILSEVKGYQRVRGAGYAILGHISLWSGKNGEAAEFYRESLEERKMAGDRKGEISSYIDLSRCLFMDGKAEGALEMLEKTVKMAEDVGASEELIRAEILKMNILLFNGMKKEVHKIAEVVEEKSRSLENQELKGAALRAVARAIFDDDRAKAVRDLEKSEKILRKLPLERSITLMVKGKFLNELGSDGSRWMKEGEKILSRTGIPKRVIQKAIYL